MQPKQYWTPSSSFPYYTTYVRPDRWLQKPLWAECGSGCTIMLAIWIVFLRQCNARLAHSDAHVNARLIHHWQPAFYLSKEWVMTEGAEGWSSTALQRLQNNRTTDMVAYLKVWVSRSFPWLPVILPGNVLWSPSGVFHVGNVHELWVNSNAQHDRRRRHSFASPFASPTSACPSSPLWASDGSCTWVFCVAAKGLEEVFGPCLYALTQRIYLPFTGRSPVPIRVCACVLTILQRFKISIYLFKTKRQWIKINLIIQYISLFKKRSWFFSLWLPFPK